MPKKKKGEAAGRGAGGGTGSSGKRTAASSGPKRSADGRGGRDLTPGSGDASSEEIRTQELRYLQEMFSEKLDPVVVHMIMEDCEFKVDVALEMLFQLSEQTSVSESQLYRLSSFKNVYVPTVEDPGGDGSLPEDSDSEDLYGAPLPQRPNGSRPDAESARSLRLRRLGQNSDNPMPPESRLQDGGAACSESQTDSISMDNVAQQTVDTPSSSSPDFLTPSECSFPEAVAETKSSGPVSNSVQNETSGVAGGSSDLGQTSLREAPQPFSSLKKLPKRSDPHVVALPGGKGDCFHHPASGENSATRLQEKGDAALGEDAAATKTPRKDATERSTDLPGVSEEADRQRPSPDAIPTEELEALLDEIEKCPESTPTPSGASETVTPARSDRLKSEKDGTEAAEKPSRSVEIGHQAGKAEGQINPGAGRAGRQGQPGPQRIDAAAPVFIPRAFVRSPLPGYQQQHHARPVGPARSAQRPQGWPQMPPGRQPPAGRASSLKALLDPPRHAVVEPFFRPIPASWEPRPRGVGLDGRPSLFGAVAPFPRPAFAGSPPPSDARPPLGRTPQLPFWTPHHPRPPPPLPSAASHHTSKALPDGLRAASPHEGARQPAAADPPRWPVAGHPPYASRTRSESPRPKGSSEDKAVPLPEGKVLCLMRGCPGSGKSTLARKLVGSGKILSTDDFFISKAGKYSFDITRLSAAHDWNHAQAQRAMESGVTPLIIDNTNIERWTMKPYVAMALKYGYAVEFREPTTPWRYKLGRLTTYNSHGVPQETIKSMLERFERDVTVENILGSSKPRKKAEAANRLPSPQSWRRPGRGEAKTSRDQGPDQGIPRRVDEPSKARTGPAWDQRGATSSPGASDSRVNGKKGGGPRAGGARRPPSPQSWRKPKEDRLSGVDGEASAGKKPRLGSGPPSGDVKPRGSVASVGPEADKSTSGVAVVEGETSWRRPQLGSDPPSSNTRPTVDSIVSGGSEAEEPASAIAAVSVPTGGGENQEERPVGGAVWEGRTPEVAAIASEVRASEEAEAALRSASEKDPDEVTLVNKATEDAMSPSVGDSVNNSAEATSETAARSLSEATSPSGGVAPGAVLDSLGTMEAQGGHIMALLNAITQTSPPETFALGNLESWRETSKIEQQVSSISEEEFQSMLSSFSEPQLVRGLPLVRPGKLETGAQDGESSRDKSQVLDPEGSFLKSCQGALGKGVSTKASGQKEQESEKGGGKPAPEKVLEGDYKGLCQSALVIEKGLSQMQCAAAGDEDEVITEVGPAEEVYCLVKASREEGIGLKTEQVQVETDNQDSSFGADTRSQDGRKDGAGVKENEGLTETSSGEHRSDAELSQTTGDLQMSCGSRESDQRLSGATEDASDCPESLTSCLPPKINVDKGEANSEIVKEGDCGQEADKTSASLRNSSEEIQRSLTDGNQPFPAEAVNQDSLLESEIGQSAVYTGDVNHNGSLVHQKQGASGSRSVVLGSPSTLAGPLSESVALRTPSPVDMPATPLGAGEGQTKCRPRSRSRKRPRSANKMAAVFPSLSPGSADWSELAEQEPGHSPGLTGKPRTPSLESAGFLKCDAGTATSAADFAAFQRFNSGRLSAGDLQGQGLRVVCGRAGQTEAPAGIDAAAGKPPSEADTGKRSSGKRSPIPATLSLHKSTMTYADSEEPEFTVERKLRDLTLLFPSVPRDDLEDILERCWGDVEWATNLLLDGSPGMGTDPWSYRDNEEAPPALPLGYASGQPSRRPFETATHLGELELDFESPAQMTAFEDLLESDDSVADALSSGTYVAAFDDRINRPEKAPEELTESFPDVEEQPLENHPNIGQVEPANAQSLSLGRKPFHIEANSNHIDIGSSLSQQDLTQADKSDASNSKQVPVHDSTHHLRETIPIRPSPSQVEDTLRGTLLPGTSVVRTDDCLLPEAEPKERGQGDAEISKSGIQNLRETAAKSQPVENAPTTVPEDDPRSERSVERQQDALGDDFRPSLPAESAGMDPSVRPKTEPGSNKVRQPSASLPKTKNLRKDGRSPPRELEFPWSGPSDEEQFQTPLPEQVMSASEESAKEEDEETSMTGEEEEGHPSPRKQRVLRSLSEGLMLQLPAAFALQLQEMFGPIGFHLRADGLPPEDLQVCVEYDLAKSLHSLWAQTLQARFNDAEELESIIKADEELARRLQQEEDFQHLSKVQSERSAKYLAPRGSPKRRWHPVGPQQGYGDGKDAVSATFASAGQPTPTPAPPLPAAESGKSLQEIMDEELAVQLSRDAEAEEKLSSGESASIATKLKRNKLFDEFPSLNRDTLEDIYRSNDYQLGPTIKQVRAFFLSASGKPRDVYSEEARDRMEKELIEKAEKESLASSEGTDDSNPSESHYQSVVEPDYEDYRAEATQHYRLRHEAFQKAAAAYNRGQKELASFYSQQGHLHTEKLKAANRRASEAILYSKNSVYQENTLDLHGLHVDEALTILEQVLADRKAQLPVHSGQQPRRPTGKSPPRHIFVITGKGNHSKGGVARLRPAVADVLKKEGYKYSMVNAGLIKVVM